MGHRHLQADEIPFAERPYREQDPVRHAASVTDALGLAQSRATIWRYPPGARGRRHVEGAQEEVFVVLAGTITLMLGEPPERIELREGGIAAVDAGTPLQVRNESDADARVVIWGAPPVRGGSEILDDLP